MDYHGRRYLRVQQFISRARDLKIRWLDERALEFYERTCLLLPTARTIEPPGMARAMAQQHYQVEITNLADLEPPIEWTRLHDDGTGDQHPFDREVGTNPWIEKPTCDSYEPWNSRDITITLASGHPMKEPTVERYYDYWQVHVVELLRTFDFKQKATVLGELKDESWLRQWYALPKDTISLRELRGMARGYDALTRFSDTYSRVMERAYQGFGRDQELPAATIDSMRQSLEAHASRIVEATGLDEPAFTRFVVDAVHLMDQYTDQERAALAADVRRDLWLAYRFARYAFRREWEPFVDAVQQIGGPWAAKTVRHMDPVEAARDEAKQNLGYILEGDIGITIDPGTRAMLPVEWTEFCVRNELLEVLKGVESYSFTEREVAADPYPWFLYRRLRPLALAVEQLARGILEVGGGLKPGDTMAGLFQTIGIGSSWGPTFVSLYKHRDANASFEQQVVNVQSTAKLGDPEDLVIARTIALAVIARNIAGHQHRELPQATVRLLAGACGRALVITWIVARRAGLV